MAQPRKTNTVALTKHATNNVWQEVKPEDQNGGDVCKLFSDSTEDIQLFVAELGVSYTADPAGSPSTSDAAMLAASFFVNAVVGEVFDFGAGVTNAIWVLKTAAANTDEGITCVY